MKILHLIQRYEPAVGGSETWCREVARRQAACGHRVRVLTLDVVRETEFWTEPSGADARLRLGRLDLDHGVEVRRFARTLPIWTLHHVVLRFLLDRLLNVFLLGPHSREMLAHLEVEMAWADVVHLHTLPYTHNVFGMRAARRAGRPIVITPHLHVGHPDYERPHLFRLLRRADRIVVISEHERQALAARGVPPDSVVVTACGAPVPPDVDTAAARIELRRRFGLSADTEVVVCVARKTREKGLGALVKAVGRLRAAGRDVVLVLAGPPFEWFDAMLAELPADARDGVFDLGVVTDREKAEALAGADIFAMPSRYEAFGIVFLEAWQAGLPVIGGDAGGQPEVIGDGGLTVPFDDPVATAEAIELYLNDPAARRLAMEHGRRLLAGPYRWERVAEEVTGVCRALLPADRLRVACVSNFYPPHVQGGAELAMAEQVLGLAGRGHAVGVFAGRLGAVTEPRAVEHEDGAVPVERIVLHPEDLSAEFGNHVNPAAAEAFGRWLDAGDAEIVHLHNLSGLSAGVIHQAADRGLAVVMTLHDYWGICVRNTLVTSAGEPCLGPGARCITCHPSCGAGAPTPFRNAELAAAMARVSLFLSPSQYLAGRYRAAGLPADRLRVLPNGLDLDRFTTAPPPAGAPLLYLGYLGRHKGLHVLLEALARPGAAGLELLVAGAGEMRETYERQARELGIGGRVQFLGAVPPEQVPELLAGCRAVVVPSLWPENAPVGITEAMAAARPVVASRLGGIPELVRDGVTGFTVPAGEPGPLAEALQRLAAEEIITAMGQAGRAAAGRLERSRVLDELEAVYRGLQDRPVAPRWRPDRPVVAVAGAVGGVLGPWWRAALTSAEASAGSFWTVRWSPTGDPSPGRLSPGVPDALLLDADGGLDACAEALALGVPAVALAEPGSRLERLARESDSVRLATDAEHAGRILGELLSDPAELGAQARRGRSFLRGLVARRGARGCSGGLSDSETRAESPSTVRTRTGRMGGTA